MLVVLDTIALRYQLSDACRPELRELVTRSMGHESFADTTLSMGTFVANRFKHPPEPTNSGIGFRLARKL